MAQCSLIEFNHNLVHDIEKDPVGFVGALCMCLKSGDNGFRRELLDRWGANVLYQRHSSTGFTVKIEYKP